MEATRTRTLEVTVISGENLYVDQNPVTENAYVVVRTESIKCWSTKMANGSLGYPSWSEKLLVEMPLYARSITFEVQCKTSKGRVRSIGVARIAISDVLGEGEGTLPSEGCLQVLSYRLRNWEGRRNGVINFSVKEKKEEEEEAKGMIGRTCDGALEKKVTANSGVVTGIPVWWIHPLHV